MSLVQESYTFSTCCVHELFWMSKQKQTICLHNMFWAFSFHGNSMNNLLSYCGLVDARISASEKDLPVMKQDTTENVS